MIVGALSLGAVGVSAGPAFATFHLNMVNEVMLASSSGDTGTQFVEFLDHGGSEELFTPAFAPYRLEVYSAQGNLLGQQTLDPSGLRAAADADTEYLVSTPAVDAAFHVTGKERLTVKLPLSAGQVCFAGGTQVVSCVTYGAISKPVTVNTAPFGTGTVHGPIPPNGTSDQRQSNGAVVAAQPTPGAANSSAPGQPIMPAPFTGVRFVSRMVPLEGRHALVRLQCPADAVSSCDGELTLTRGPRTVGHSSFRIASAGSTTVIVTLSRTLGHHLRLRAQAVAHDGAGRTIITSSRLRLTRSAASGALVRARLTRLGMVLADPRGFTLYLFARDGRRHATCYGACAGAWPPLATNGFPRAGAGVNPAMLGVTRRSDGRLQVTYNGHPLYDYLGDSAPGQTHGEGLKQFGARWYAVAPSGRALHH
jgi:predicted lipoprotein with Yx(FWY)xxD motif